MSIGIPTTSSNPITIYVGVTSTGLSTRDFPQSKIVNLQSNGSRKWLSGAFALKKNTINPIEITIMKIDLDRTKFRIFHMPSVVVMSDYFVSILVDHFLCGLSLPHNPVFFHLLNLIEA